MTGFLVVENGPWRIHPSAFGVGHATVKYCGDEKAEIIATESLADLALLRDAITEYLDAAHSGQAGTEK